MSYDFDRVIDRRTTNSNKWKKYGQDVLPLWVADMDFPAPEPVQNALRRAVEHGVYGYEDPTEELARTVAARMDRLYGWHISPQAVVATPGVIAGFNAAARTVCMAGEGILVQPPVYPPFMSVHDNVGLVRQVAELRQVVSGQSLHYEVDWDVLANSFNAGARTGMFLLCNPHNPTGQIFPPGDLLRIADLCKQNNTIICSDEIHSEILLGGSTFYPLAAQDDEIARRTITLIAPSKTFNVPGLYCAFAIIVDEKLRQQYKRTVARMAMHVNSLGLIAAQAAFSGECDQWLSALRLYLTANRDYLVSFVQRELNGMLVTVPDATYLAWLDCRELIKQGKIEGSPLEFFLSKAKVALHSGADYGPGGEGFVRLNFGCPRSTLQQALEKMQTGCELAFCFVHQMRHSTLVLILLLLLVACSPVQSQLEYEVITHPDGPLYVGDQVSFEVIGKGEQIDGETVDVTLDGQSLGSTPFAPFGIGQRQEATLWWTWDTSSLEPDRYTLNFELGSGYSWNESFLLHPAKRTPLADSQWAEVLIDCCAIHYITGTAAERDLSELTAIADQQSESVAAQMGTSMQERIDVTFMPRVIGHGGFAWDGLYISYLDGNYSGNEVDIILHHEFVHFYDGWVGGDYLPSIFQEGLATYLSGGHFKIEPIMSRAAALLELDRYIPLETLANDFYKQQHETGYLEAAALVGYLYETYGPGSFNEFYRTIPFPDGSTPAEVIDTALQESLTSRLLSWKTTLKTTLPRNLFRRMYAGTWR